jgi:PKD repeat protein
MLRSRVALLALAGVAMACGEPQGPVGANLAPVASAGGPYVASTLSVALTGAASTDPDSNLPLAYAWDLGDGATGSGEAPTHTYDAPGSYQVTLRVTDSRGAVSEPSTTSAVVTRRTSTALTVAGNIASCGHDRDAATAALLDGIPGSIAALGDNAFPEGTARDYTQCYGPTWGRHLGRTYAVLGNHDYQTGSAAAAFDYFGDRAGPRALGYYSFELDDWHLIVLNDNAPYVEFGAGSPQDQWLAADLAANPKPCVLAMWHQPRFTSSNEPGGLGRVTRQSLWQRLYDAGAEIVLNGQEHHYERMRPMTPDGTPDDARGIRQFNVGTGGESVALPTVAIHPQSEILAAEFGVLTLTLASGGYAWEFIPVPGSTFSDSGLATCH